MGWIRRVFAFIWLGQFPHQVFQVRRSVVVALGKSPLQSLRYGLLGFVSADKPVQSDDHMAKSPAFPAVQSFSPAIGNE